MKKSIMDEVAEENKVETSNGNHEEQSAVKSGGAEKGGPAQDKAFDRQPPDAETPRTPKEPESPTTEN